MELLSCTGLPADGLISIPVDEELDRYRLLAYLQRVEARYREHKLYPHMDELRIRLEQLGQLRARKEELLAGMPRGITGLDLRSGEVLRAAVQDDELLRSIDAMISKAMPELHNALDRGAELREQLAGRIRFEPVGVLPLWTDEGYLLLHQGREARVYAYALSALGHRAGPLHRQILRTHYMTRYVLDFSCTYEHVKADLVKRCTDLPNPAVFAFTSDLSLPAIETFVPLAKQLVYEMIATRRT